MAKPTIAEKKANDRPAPDLVRVRATERGYYAVAEVFDFKQFDGTKKRELGRNDVIRNEGDVFEYDTVDMKPWAKLTEQQREGRDSVKTARGEFALPRWVVLASKRERETVPAGHTTTFRDETVNKVQTENDVI